MNAHAAATLLDPNEFKGNWEHRSCFVWFNQPEDANEFGLRILSHRDSGSLDQSNDAVTRKRLAAFVGSGDVIFFDCSHWAVGITHEVAVRVHKVGTSETTDAFDELARIVDEIDQYPILDESDYSDREYESAIEGISLAILGSEIDSESLPDSWEQDVHRWLDEHAPRELENSDDQGAFPSVESVTRALSELGLTHPRA